MCGAQTASNAVEYGPNWLAGSGAFPQRKQLKNA